MPRETQVVIVGAGPAGLATSACLTRVGIAHALVERESVVAPAWRRHYDRLHLHTSRGFSGLPHHGMARRFSRYPSRAQVVEYLEEYVEVLGLRPLLGVEVQEVGSDSGAWTLRTSAGTVRTRSVVVAAGANGEPAMPRWTGIESFPGPVVHSSSYRNGQPHADQDVLVVGFGNSGGEIALDLLEHGARPVLSVRSAVNVVPRDILGIPILAIAIPLARLPAGVADALVWPILKLHYPSYRRLGLRKAPRGPFRQIADRSRIPLLDIGTIRELRRGRIRVAPDIAEVRGRTVTYADGSHATFDAIVCATGYRPASPPGIPMDGPGFSGVASRQEPGLYRCGYYVSPTGMLREIGLEAREIARRIRRLLQGRTE